MDFYAQFSKYYDAIFPVDETKLQFFQQLFTRHNVTRVLDIACGTGGYSLELAKAGFQVTGLDLEENMIEQAREKARKQGLPVQFKVGDMRELPAPTVPYEGLICIGNSLAHLTTWEELIQAVSGFREQLRPKGLCLIQLVNYERIFTYNLKGLPTKTNESAGIELERHYDRRLDGLLDFRTVLRVNEGRQVQEYQNIVVLNPLHKGDLEDILYECGFTNIKFYGDFQGNEYSPDSPGLIGIAVSQG